MKSKLIVVLFVLTASISGNAQIVNSQLTEQSIIRLNGPNGKTIVFSIPEAKATSKALWEQIDPYRSDNQYMPPAMKERLAWIRDKAYRFDVPMLPNDWSMQAQVGSFAAEASAKYCSIPGTEIKDKPCIFVYVSILILDMKLVFNLDQPNQRFKNSFALNIAHEGVHLERGHELDREQGNQEKVALEEIRAWHKVIRDMAAPLRKMGQPISVEYENVDDLLKSCSYKLPCKAFETFIRKHKVVDVKNLKQ